MSYPAAGGDSDSQRELCLHEEPPACSGGAPATAAGATAAGAPAPQVTQLNVSSDSRVHMGPKFVSVTRTVHNNKVVQELGAARFVWEWARRTSRAELVACAAALAALAACAALAAALAARPAPTDPDLAPHPWNISRRMWLAGGRLAGARWAARFVPLRLVVVQHTAGMQCARFDECAALMRRMQQNFLNDQGYELPYHFVVGNDGRVYEGRGWDYEDAPTRVFHRCALGVGFTGDYRDVGGARPSAQQLNRTLALLAGGVRAGALHARHAVVAARDVQATASPGDHLYAAVAAWPNFDAAAARFRGASCEEVYAALSAEDPLPPAPQPRSPASPADSASVRGMLLSNEPTR